MTHSFKRDSFAQSLREFLESDKETMDYMRLFVAFNNVIRPADGLVWSEVEGIVEYCLDERIVTHCILDDIGEVWAWDGERLFLVSAEEEWGDQNGEPCQSLNQAIDMLFEYWYIAP